MFDGTKPKLVILTLSILLLGVGCVLPNQQEQVNDVMEERVISNKIDLSGQGLTKVPEYIFNATNLEELDLSNNKLTGVLPAEIRNLQNLKALNVSDNQMTGVPAEIGQLQNLDVLNLANNKLTGLPYELGNLKKLQFLNIRGNNYSQLDLDVIKQKLPASVRIIK